MLVGGLSDENKKAINVANILAGPNLHMYVLNSPTTFVRLYRIDGTELEYNVNTIDPKKLADWAFHSSRPILMPLDSDFNAEYLRDQQDYEYILILIDRVDDFSKLLEPLLSEACHQHSKTILCIRVDYKSKYFGQYIGVTRARGDKSSFTILKERN